MHEQKLNETRDQYLKRALKWCKKRFAELREIERYRHISHVASQAMLDTEKEFSDLGTFGVEGIQGGNNRHSPGFDYLNTGDTYCRTIVYVYGAKRPWRLTSWGNIVEYGSYN